MATSSTSVIDEPFQLVRYSFPSRGRSKKQPLNHIFASHQNSSSNKSTNGEGYITVSAHADGIHILEVSTLHPVISLTLGPSTSFSCPSITLPSLSGDVHTYTTYAAIESSPELSSPDEGGRTLWKWIGNTSSMALIKEKSSKIIMPSPGRIHGLYSSRELQGRLLVLSTTGQLLVLDAETLDQKASTLSSPKHSTSTLIRAFVLSGSACSFASLPSSSRGAIVVVAASDTSSSLRLQIFFVDEQSLISQLKEYEFPQKRDEIADLSCSSSGCFTILCKDGTWHSYKIMTSDSDSAPSAPTLLSDPFQLAKFNLPSSTSPQCISLLSLGSSHILLAGISSSEIKLHIWDLQYSILLASHSFAVPSAFASSPLTLKLVEGSLSKPSSTFSQIRGQAILILSPFSAVDQADQASRPQPTISSVLIVPYVVPQISTIAAALGRGPSSKVWVKASTSTSQKTSKEAVKDELISTMRNAMESGKGTSAEIAFFAWIKSESEPNKEGEESTQGPAFFSPTFGYVFVKELLDVIFSLSNPNARSSSAYPRGVLKYLLERKLISNGMVEGGLLKQLAARNDWASIELCFSNVIDLPESDVVYLLQIVVVSHRRNNSKDAMDVDSTPSFSSMPSLLHFLTLCIKYPTTPKPLILAFRKHLGEAEDVTCVAEMLELWIKESVDRRKVNGEPLLPTKKDLEKNEHGVWIVNAKKREAKKNSPPLDMVIKYLQSLMDASFLALLQYPPAHKLLEHLQNEVEVEVAYADLVGQLRGPLEPFAINHQKTLKEAAIPEKEKEKQKQTGDWRQRRNTINSGVGDIGLYQLEELVI